MKQCPTPGKGSFRSKAAALYAIANGAHGNTAYLCRCGCWHTTSRVRRKPKVRK